MIDPAESGRLYAARDLFVGAGETVSHAEFAAAVAAGRARLTAPAGPAAVGFEELPMEWNRGCFARLLALLQAGRNVSLAQLPEGSEPGPFAAAAPLLVLRTGGTTGAPRHVVHAFERLAGRYPLLERPPTRSLILYAPDHIAGLDAFFQSLARGATLVLPGGREPAAIARAIEQQRVQVLPATPTFLQFLLLSGELEGRDLESVEVIPHGAEPMPAALRERVSTAFPRARLVQRFGLTELGAVPVEPDPADPDALFLSAAGRAQGFDWKIANGELLIRSPARMLGTLEDGPVDAATCWHRTGDLAEWTPRGSLRILGRREALINVGGAKVIPETVEALLLEQPDVRDAAVHGAPHPLTGQAVAARVVFAGQPDPAGLMRRLRAAVRAANLPLALAPTRIEAVAHLEKTAIGKRARPRGKA
jgi:acyl-coenzyme A synthetase/AMP-(fatty) acid ligase